MTDRDISDLCPELQTIYGQWLENCHAVGLKVKAIVTWRSPADQDAAKASGLSNAAAGQSPHNCYNEDGSPGSKAFDFGVFNDNASYVADGTDSRYNQAAGMGKQLGLVWGGDWHHPDYDHLEISDWRAV